MSKQAPSVVNCPHCGKQVIWNEASHYKPFCSERCRMIDLGDWLSERNVIPGEAPAETDLSDTDPG